VEPGLASAHVFSNTHRKGTHRDGRAGDGRGAKVSRPVLKVVGLFNPMVRELYEMLYQNDSPYWFDSTKFSREFGVAGTPYGDGIRIVANSCKKV